MKQFQMFVSYVRRFYGTRTHNLLRERMTIINVYNLVVQDLLNFLSIYIQSKFQNNFTTL